MASKAKVLELPERAARYPAGPGDNTRPVTWPALHMHVTLRNGEQARYFGVCPVTKRHRLGTLARTNTPDKPVYYIWLLDDCGRCRCSPGPSDYDYLPAEQVSA